MIRVLLFLAILAVNAAAQLACAGKTVYIKLPVGWNTSSVFLWNNSYREFTEEPLTSKGAWHTFTVPALTTSFGISKSGNLDLYGVNAGTNSWIGRGLNYNVEAEGNPTSSLLFNCSDFEVTDLLGFITSYSNLYIWEKPTYPGITCHSVEESGKCPLAAQTVTWPETLGTVDILNPPITLSATVSTRFPVTYTSSNTNVATVNGKTLSIVGTGSATITLNQAGDENFAPVSVPRTIDVIIRCSGKTVNIELPKGWGNNIYYYSDGTFQNFAVTKKDKWSSFTLANITNDGSNKNFMFTDLNDYYSSAGIYSINRNTVSKSTQINTLNEYMFKCSDFGNSANLYIMENPENPGKPLISTQPQNVRHFYFLPPNKSQWLISTPYFFGPGVLKKMDVDGDRCGWYKMTFFNEPVPDASAFIISNAQSDNAGVIGLYGVDEYEFVGGLPRAINLKEVFDMFLGEDAPGSLFFAADLGLEGWSRNDPMIEEKNRCSYNFAAIIYDTDASVNTSFDNAQNEAGTGIRKGIPKETLVNGKMEFNQAKNGWTQQNFIDAFKPTLGKNITRCYDMPFQRNANSLWEFNSNKLCRDGSIDLANDCKHIGYAGTDAAQYWGNFQGGFFPPQLQTRGDVDYSSCPTCDTKRETNNFVRTDPTKISEYCYDRGRSGLWDGTGTGACGVAFGEGDFGNGDSPGIWNGGDWNSGKSFMGAGAYANELFCFESHAEFFYEHGQEFFFSGDDDIWVYINNKLVIDLGGTHLAAPGYVNLDDLGLTEGEKYPINIFFCDRRLNMANVRIATNLYFAQQLDEEIGLHLGGNKDIAEITPICLTASGGMSCANRLSGGQATVLCDKEIAANLKYYITNRAGTMGSSLANIGVNRNGVLLDASNKEVCTEGSDNVGDYLFCYNGIKIYIKGEKAGNIQILSSNIVGFDGGTYQVWATYMGDPNPPPLKIAEFTNGVLPINTTPKLNPLLSIQNISARSFAVSAALPANSDGVLNVYNLNGNLISQHKLSNGSAKISVPGSGAYVFRLSGKGIITRSKLVTAR